MITGGDIHKASCRMGIAGITTMDFWRRTRIDEANLVCSYKYTIKKEDINVYIH